MKNLAGRLEVTIDGTSLASFNLKKPNGSYGKYQDEVRPFEQNTKSENPTQSFPTSRLFTLAIHSFPRQMFFNTPKPNVSLQSH